MEWLEKIVELVSMLGITFGTPIDSGISYGYAVCHVVPNPSLGANVLNPISGTVRFRQEHNSDNLEMKVSLAGFMDSNQEHGFHIHTYGDVSRCESMSGHFNPHGLNHGSPDSSIRHVGDLGNIRPDINGRVEKSFNDSVASLFGDISIVGRGIVIHAGKDDLGTGGNAGSLATGNAGARIACCTISHCDGSLW